MAVLGVALALAACGGSGGNGVASKSPDQILNAASNAMIGAKSFRASVSGKIGGSTLDGQLDLVANKGASGTFTAGHGVLDLVVTGGTIYMRGNSAIWDLLTHNTAAGQLLGGRWVKASASDTSLSGVTDLAQLNFTNFTHAIRQDDGTVTKGSTSTVNGQKVIALHSSKGGTIYVATTGKPYLVSSVGGTIGSGTFSDYGHSFSIKPPSHAINIAQLQQRDD